MRSAITGGLAGFALAGMVAAQAQDDSWEAVASMPTARESVAACTVDGMIYAVGGFPGGSDAGLTTVERYNPANDAWSQAAPMSTGRRMPVTGAVNGRCYVIGGRVSDTPSPLDEVEEYNPATNTWRSRAPMPTPRFGHAAAVVDGVIYVVGGTDGNLLLNTLEAYDPASNSWTTLSPVPMGRPLLGATALDGKIYAMGGTFDGAGTRFTRLDIYDPATDTWSMGADMPVGKFSLQAATANGRVYAIGGADGFNSINDVAAYDPVSDTWSVVSPMITRRSRFAAVALDDRIYAIGGTLNFGGNDHVGMALTERYTPAPAGEPFVINPGLNDAWFNSDTAGQGFFIIVFEDTGIIFMAWFTYDTELPADDVQAFLGAAEHRWLTAQGTYDGDMATLDVFLTEGGIFDLDEPAPTTGESIGTITIVWTDCENGVLTYAIDPPGVSGEIPISRIVPDNVALCEALAIP